MPIKHINLLLGFIPFLLFSCIQKEQPAPSKEYWSDFTSVPTQEAQLLKIRTKGNQHLLSVINPWDTSRFLAHYWLVPKTSKLPERDIPDTITLVRTPIEKLVTLASPHIGIASLLGVDSLIIGHSQHQYIYNPGLIERSIQGDLVDVGGDHRLDIEKVIDLHPDLIIATGNEKTSKTLETIQGAGIPIAWDVEWMEKTPLGRVEWMKFLAHFFGLESKANQLFAERVAWYREAQQLTQNVSNYPTIMAGIQFKGTWYVPGGQSYLVQLLKDVGVQYEWMNDHRVGSIPMSFEAILERQIHADYWINPDGMHSLEQMEQADPRYTLFKPYRNGNVFNINKKLNSRGANDYWESGLLNPHFLLQDLVKIFHPEILPNYELQYYQKLAKKAPDAAQKD